MSALPTLAGSGTRYDSRSAMMGDATLAQQVDALANTTDNYPVDLEAAVQAVMCKTFVPPPLSALLPTGQQGRAAGIYATVSSLSMAVDQ